MNGLFKVISHHLSHDLEQAKFLMIEIFFRLLVDLRVRIPVVEPMSFLLSGADGSRQESLVHSRIQVFIN